MATFDVLLPVKNGIDYLAEAIDSICQQTFKDWRLLVLDHGSTDGSLELAQRYAEQDPRIDEAVKRVIEAVDTPGDHISEIGLLKSQIKDAVSSFLYEQTKRRPLVFPVVVEV